MGKYDNEIIFVRLDTCRSTLQRPSWCVHRDKLSVRLMEDDKDFVIFLFICEELGRTKLEEKVFYVQD